MLWPVGLNLRRRFCLRHFGRAAKKAESATSSGIIGETGIRVLFGICTLRPVFRHSFPERAIGLWLATLLLSLISGCTTFLVSDYDKESIERTTDISRDVLALYQQTLSIEPEKRSAAVTGSLKSAYGEIETRMRLHLLREQGRRENTDSVTIAANMLASWQKFSVSHRSTDPTALSDTQLNIERGILERHLRSAFIAEEAKKLGGGASE